MLFSVTAGKNDITVVQYLQWQDVSIKLPSVSFFALINVQSEGTQFSPYLAQHFLDFDWSRLLQNW